uniref:Uncharacterized protein n=1 Tax=Tanacetum cinerariifolium TaxID=118510 RepID=A0A699HZP5_TANCI|nr:hypothetical protein [Tanacetum cinerariifolium]
MENSKKLKLTEQDSHKRCLFELRKVGRACGSRGKWWSGAEMGESDAASGGGKNGLCTVGSNVGRRQGSIIVYFTQLVPGLVRD